MTSDLPSTAAPLIPMKDFFRNPEIVGCSISPDGNRLAYMKPWESRLNIFVRKIDEQTELRLTSAVKRDISSFFWKGNNRIVYMQDDGGDENFHLFSVGIDGMQQKDLTPFPDIRAQVIDDLEEIENEILIGLNRRNPEVFDVFRMDVSTGQMTMIAENPGSIVTWLTDHDGKLRVAVSTDGVNASMMYRATESDEFRIVLMTNFRESAEPIQFTFDNRHLYLMSNIGRDKIALVTYDPDGAREIETLYEHPDVDIERLITSRKHRKALAVSFITWKHEYHFLDAERERMQRDLEDRLPGHGVVGIVSKNKDEDKFIVIGYSDRSNGSYYFHDAVSGRLEKLATISPWIDEDKMAAMKPITFQSRDGLTIHGYLTLPHGLDPENLPVVVNPHGGPWHRDQWAFNPEVQFLANRGYAVLQVNFRGSTGYGRKFWESSFKQWGRTMQNDITDGVEWLVAQGIADPARIGIYGASYGGYATLAGLTFTPDLYACGVDYVGVSNLFTFMKSIPPYWKPGLEMMYEMVGDPEKDAELMRSASPVYHVDQIRVPLLIAQGANDPRVNKNESDQMVEALKARGIDVPYIVKDNEGHAFHNEENRFEFYRVMEEFLGKHLGGTVEKVQ